MAERQAHRHGSTLGQIDNFNTPTQLLHRLVDHPQAEAMAEGAEAPSATAVRPLPWLLPFRQAMRTALLAELDTRLQPVLGLVEAFNAYQPKEQ